MTTPNNTVAGRPFDLNPRENPERARFEEWYTTHAFDYAANPIGSRDCDLQWRAWKAALASPAPSAGVGVGDRFALWFFRDLSNDQRLVLFALFGLPVDQVSTQSAQRLGLNHVLSQHPAAPSVSPAYDRELIARMLDDHATCDLMLHHPDAIREQARLLREADNAEAASIRTVNRPPSVAGDVGELPEEIEAIVCPLEDDAAGMLEREPQDGTALNMQAAAALIRRLATAEQPGSAVQGEAVAEVGPGWQLLYIGSGPIAEICRLHPGLRIGSKLYTTPPPAPAAEQGVCLCRAGAYKMEPGCKHCEPAAQPEARGVEGMVPESEVADALRERVKEAGSQQAFALQVKASTSYVSDVLNGKREIPEDWVFGLGYRKGGWVRVRDPLTDAAAPSGVRVDDAMVCSLADYLGKRGGPLQSLNRAACERIAREYLTAALSANEVSRG